MSKKRAVTFFSTNYALRAEKVLRSLSIDVIVIPTPRYLSSTCGIALKYDEDSEEKIKEILNQEGIEFEGTYSLEPS